MQIIANTGLDIWGIKRSLDQMMGHNKVNFQKWTKNIET